MRRSSIGLGIGLGMGLGLGCNVSAVAPSAGVDGGLGGGTSTCPRAIVALDTDYMSTNVSVLSPSGAVLTGSLISSAATPPGLSEALSGDVILPYAAPTSGALVLIDQKNNAIIWTNASTGAVEAELSVATGFEADPTDYLEVSATKAYVSRYDSNTAPGMQPYDEGGDVLIVDTKTHAITGRIDMSYPDDGTLLPRAYRLLAIGTEVWVGLEQMDATYMKAGDDRIAGIDPATDARTFELDLKDLWNCGGFAVSPSGKVVAVACSGDAQTTTDTTHSAVVTIDATRSPPVELQRYPVAATFGGSLAPNIAFASETLLVGVVEGDLTITPARNDVAYTLDLTTGATTKLLDAGAPFKLGTVLCTPGCGDRCALADMKANVVRFWSIADGAFGDETTVAPDPSIGLPPVGLGGL